MKIPGFIDLQVNGYKGVDFSSMDLAAESFISVASELFAKGTAAFLPTLITSPREVYQRNLPLIAKAMDSPELKHRILGIHIEGPFLSSQPGAVGAHNPNFVSAPSIEYLKELQQWANGKIKLITIAAEIDGAEELTRYAVKNGITVSLGHQMADYNDMSRLADAGAKSITHLGNGMPNEVNRHKNVLLAGISNDKLTGMIITDGHHLPDFVIKAIIRGKGVSNIIVVSDSSPIAGLKPGTYNVLGNEAVLEENGLLHNPQKKCLVGSSATMLECMNYLTSLDLLSQDELFMVGFYNPLKLIGLDASSIKNGREIKFNSEKKVFTIVQ